MTTETSEAILTREPRKLPPVRKPKEPFHPGWVMLGVAAAAVYMSAPGQSYSVAAFIDPMLTDLELKRTQYSTAYCVATLLGGLTLPWIGRMVDSYGARRMLPIVAFFLGLACLWMGSIHHIVALYVGFSLIRCLGQGTLTLISTWLIGEWFEHRRGLATGLIGLGGTLSIMSVPQINDWIIGEYGWRTSWGILAAAVWIVLILPGIFLVRNRPEDMGLLPDWKRPSDLEGETAEPVVSAKLKHHRFSPTRESWTVREAYRTATFWKILAVISTSSMIGTGLIFHQVSLLGEQGVSRSDTFILLGFQALVGTVSGVVAGYLTDRMQARYLLAACSLFMAAALLLLIVMPSPGYAFLYSGLLGLQGGIIRSTGTVIWINYYGRLYQGAVRGLAMSVMVIAAAFGPLPLAFAKDYLGGYQVVLCSFLLLPLLAAIVVLTATVPVKNSSGERQA
jgi:MFS family permease